MSKYNNNITPINKIIFFNVDTYTGRDTVKQSIKVLNQSKACELKIKFCSFYT